MLLIRTQPHHIILQHNMQLFLEIDISTAQPTTKYITHVIYLFIIINIHHEHTLKHLLYILYDTIQHHIYYIFQTEQRSSVARILHFCFTFTTSTATIV